MTSTSDPLLPLLEKTIKKGRVLPYYCQTCCGDILSSQGGRQSEPKVNIRNTEYEPALMMAPRTLEPGTLMVQHQRRAWISTLALFRQEFLPCSMSHTAGQPTAVPAAVTAPSVASAFYIPNTLSWKRNRPDCCLLAGYHENT